MAQIKVRGVSSWSNPKAAKVWNGTRWIDRVGKYWTGTRWEDFISYGLNFQKITSSFTKPSGRGHSVVFSPNEEHLIVGSDANPYINAYKRSGDNFTKISIPAMPFIADKVDYSSNGIYLAGAAGGTAVPYITIYKVAGDTFIPLPNSLQTPAPSGIMQGEGVSLSDNADYLAISQYDKNPRFRLYKRTGDTFGNLSTPIDYPNDDSSYVYDVALSPNSNYLAVCNTNELPYLRIYKRSGDNFTRLPDLSTLPTGSVFRVKFSRDNSLLGLQHHQSARFSVYRRNGDTFTKIPDPAIALSGISSDIAFSSDSRYVAVSSFSGEIYIYWIAPNELIKVSELNTGVSVQTYITFSPSDQYLAAASYDFTTRLTIYKQL